MRGKPVPAFPEFKPSALQAAAIKRIREFRHELASHGLYVRSGMELEFTVEDRKGNLVPSVLDLNKADAYLLNDRTIPLFQRIKPDSSSDYEINVSDKFDDARLVDPESFSPVLVSATVERMRTRTLKQILLEHSCLNQEREGGEPPFSPVYRPRPIIGAGNDSPEEFKNKTSSLQVSVSLYDEDGHNLFTEHPLLLEHCARSLVEVQKDAALSMISKPDSIRRFDSDTHVSVASGIGMEKIPPKPDQHSHNSVMIRGGGTFAGKRYEVGDPGYAKHFYHRTRIENRLPGADTDPFVAMAVTLAALVDVVRKADRNNELAPLEGIPPPKYDLPADKHGFLQQFRQSEHIKELLGKELFNSITKSFKHDNDIVLLA